MRPSRSVGSWASTVLKLSDDSRLARLPCAVSMTASAAPLLLAKMTVWLAIAYAPPEPLPVADVTVTPSCALVVHCSARPTRPLLNLSRAAWALASSLLAMRTVTSGELDDEAPARGVNDDSADAGMATDSSEPSHGLMSLWLRPERENAVSSHPLMVALRDWSLNGGNLLSRPWTASFWEAGGSKLTLT